MSASPANPSHPTVAFADWSAQLEADASLSPGLRASYRVALTRFLAFCARRGTAPTVALAREHVDLVRLEHAPSPGRLQEWKDGLNWYFRRGREATVVAMKDVPPLAQSDLGTTPWEAALIAHLRQQQRSWRTEQTYRGWLWRFMGFLGSRPLAEVTGSALRDFLTKLATEERISAATQRQALNALVFFFREVEGRDLGDFSDFVRARKRTRVPVVLSRAECERLFEAMEGTPRLIGRLLYGTGMRLMVA